MDGKNYFTFILIIFSTACAQELNSTELLELIDQFQSTFDINAACSNFTNQPASIGVDISCRQQLDVVCRNASLLLTMLDATSKFPYNGIATSTRLDLGNFDQCVRIDTTADVKNESIRVLGKHCSPGFIIPVIKNNSDAMAIFMDSFKLAICIPDKCSAKDLENITGLPLFNDEFCLTKERQGLSTGDIAILTTFAIIILVIIASTAYDIYLSRRKITCSNQYLISFSVLTNGKKLFNIPKANNEQILVFHGIKTISMLWIIGGHCYNMWASLPISNQDMALEWRDKTLYSFYITSAYLAVDTFFYISGFLFAYQYLKQEDKPTKNHINDIPLLYLHRYLRLTPALLMIYLLLVGVFNNLTYGPISNFGSQEFVAPCYTNWWSVFLYVQNYYSPEKWCMVNTWYLCADMQIFILAPILAIPVAKRIRKNMRETMIALFFINVFFAILPLINVIWPDLYYNQYDTQSRLIDYGIGFMMGAYMRQNKSKPFKLSSAVNKLIWTLGILVMLAILLIYKVMDINYGFTPHQVFFTLMRPTWCLGLCWIVYSCYHGYGGLINWILTLRCCQIGSRLSYSMYLIHMPLLYVSVANLRERKFFSDYNAFYETCAITVITIVVSIFWTLAFESPIIVLEKYLFKVKINKPKKKNIDIDIKVVENHVENNKI